MQALCHIFKYPSGDVCGVFISSRSEPDRICGCVPLFHSTCVTVPIMRTCMALLEQVEDCVIAAIYYASDNTSRIPQYVELLHSQIKQVKKEDVPIMRFDSASMPERGYPFSSTFDDSSDAREGLTFSKIELDIARDIFHKKLHLTIVVDFEDHMDDPRRDWLRAVDMGSF